MFHMNNVFGSVDLCSMPMYCNYVISVCVMTQSSGSEPKQFMSCVHGSTHDMNDTR